MFLIKRSSSESFGEGIWIEFAPEIGNPNSLIITGSQCSTQSECEDMAFYIKYTHVLLRHVSYKLLGYSYQGSLKPVSYFPSIVLNYTAEVRLKKKYFWSLTDGVFIQNT
jgi:hypothetical protein